MDLLVRNARILDREGELVDIAVSGSSIAEVGRRPGSADNEIDAGGNLVLPTFVEPHVHLDKAFLLEQEGKEEATSIAEARRMVREAKRKFTASNVQPRMEKAISSAIENGVTFVRTHVDVDGVAGLTSVEAAAQLRKQYAGLVDLEIVAFPQEGLIKNNPGGEELLRKALDMGAGVVGGLPEAESSLEDSRKQIDRVLDIASEGERGVDVHCDVLPTTRTIEYYASRLIERNWSAGATADHLIALSYYDEPYAASVIELVKKARINVVSNPCTMMTAGATERPPLGRGVTRIRELARAGVNLAFGLDNVVDPYNPFGDFNPLANGWLLAYAGQLSTIEEIKSILRMPTFNSARILGIERYGLGVGDRADFNVLSSPDARSALRFHSKPRYVVKGGRIVVENKFETVRHPHLTP